MRIEIMNMQSKKSEIVEVRGTNVIQALLRSSILGLNHWHGMSDAVRIVADLDHSDVVTFRDRIIVVLPPEA